MELTHFDENGKAIMIDISAKKATVRSATAAGKICMSDECFKAVASGTAEKGDVLGVARIAGITGVKNTSGLIPLCHPLQIEEVCINFELSENAVYAYCTVKTTGKTGVEMEALTGVTAALLTIYDMTKAIDKSSMITDIFLQKKSGGKSGTYERINNQSE